MFDIKKQIFTEILFFNIKKNKNYGKNDVFLTLSVLQFIRFCIFQINKKKEKSTILYSRFFLKNK